MSKRPKPKTERPYDGALHHAVRASREAFDVYRARLRLLGSEAPATRSTGPCPPQHADNLRQLLACLNALETQLRDEAIEQLESCIGGGRN